MNSKYLNPLNDHLSKLGLSPKILYEPCTMLAFFLAEEIQSELVFGVEEESHINLSMITALDVQPHPDLSTFALTLASRIIPVEINTIEKKVVLRINLTGSQEGIFSLVDEGIVTLRLIVGAVFTEALKLTSKQSSLFTALDSTIELLNFKRATK